MAAVDRVKELTRILKAREDNGSKEYEMLSVLVSGASEEDILAFRGDLYTEMINKYMGQV